jgi:hypothetical protein
MTRLSVVVGESCAKHPLLKKGSKPPRVATLNVSPKLLFSLATLRHQQSIKGRRTFKETQKLWTDLLGIHGVELTFQKNDLAANTADELLKNLSEIVGIGCGLAAMRTQFNLNINRFRRYKGVAGKRRLDFEYFRGNNRFFHETKGTTNKYAISKIKEDIEEQKEATKKQNKKPLDGRQLMACTGSIVLYRRSVGSTYGSSVELLDPPSRSENLPYRENDELSSVLRYYRHFYSVTHFDPQNLTRLSLTDWLDEVVQGLELRLRPPRQAPNVFARPRRSERSGGLVYGGTVFDARIADITVRKFRTFGDATRALENPVTFVGVANEVTAAIRECRWRDLLEFDDQRIDDRRDSERGVALESGILTQTASLSDGEERESAATFARLRSRAELQGRVLG